MKAMATNPDLQVPTTQYRVVEALLDVDAAPYPWCVPDTATRGYVWPPRSVAGTRPVVAAPAAQPLYASGHTSANLLYCEVWKQPSTCPAGKTTFTAQALDPIRLIRVYGGLRAAVPGENRSGEQARSRFSALAELLDCSMSVGRSMYSNAADRAGVEWFTDTETDAPQAPRHRYRGVIAPAAQGAAALSEPRVTKFVQTLYELSQSTNEHGGVDSIFQFLDERLIAADFEACDRALARIDVERILPSFVVAILMVTLRAEPRLSFRRVFHRLALERFTRERGAERAKRLLAKYR
jgi:hypothetical protein